MLYWSISTRSATPIASAPPEPPSPITTLTIGTFRLDITNRLRAMASLWPRSSAPIPGYAPGVSISVISGKPNFSARCMSRKRLAVTFGPRHAVVAPHALFRVAAFLMADDDDGLAVEARQAADERMIVGVHAVAVQLLEIGEALVDVVERVRPLRVTRELRDLPRA